MSSSPRSWSQENSWPPGNASEHPASWQGELATEAASRGATLKKSSPVSPSQSQYYAVPSMPPPSPPPGIPRVSSVASGSRSSGAYNGVRTSTVSPISTYQGQRSVSEDYTQAPADYRRASGPGLSNHLSSDRRTVSDGHSRYAPPSDYAPSISGDPELSGDLLNGFGDDAYDPAMDAPKQFRPQQRAQVLPIRHPAQPPPRSQAQPQPINVSLDGSNRLVIAIDFGTTYTGIAFATPSTEEVRNLEKDIYLVTNWGHGMNNEQKIPSVYSYSPPTAANEQQFGYDLSPSAVAMVNTKLELDTQDTKLAELESLIHALEGMKNLSYANVRRSDGNPGFSWKSSEEIVTDYLTKVFEAFSRYLDRVFPKFSGTMKENYPVDLVITVPVQWSYKARNSTYRAVINAGFNPQSFLKMERIIMIREPEAAALYAVRWLKDENVEFLKVGDCFVLCDAGGGTVDVVAYKVLKLEPLELKQIGHPTCRKCGSIYIDAKFKEWLRGHLGRHWRELDPKTLKGRINAQTTEGERMREVMRNFDGFKKAFGETQREVHFRLPEPLDNLTVRNVIRAGEVNISHEQMQAFFKDSVDGTISLILNQITQAETGPTGGRRVKNIIMVGGFAESKYLQSEIRKSLSYRKIKLQRPSTSWTAVVQGAVITGVEHMSELTPLKACPKNFGIRLDEDFSGLHNDLDERVDEEITGRMVALGQLHWLVQQGDLLDATEPRVQTKTCPFTFPADQSMKFSFPIFECILDDPDDDLPKRWHNSRDEVHQIMDIEVDMSSIPIHIMEKSYNHGRPYYTAKTTCKMSYHSNHQLEVQMIYNGKLVGSCTKNMGESHEDYGDDYVDYYD